MECAAAGHERGKGSQWGLAEGGGHETSRPHHSLAPCVLLSWCPHAHLSPCPSWLADRPQVLGSER